MNVYQVTIFKGNSSQYIYNVLARDAGEAIANINRYAKQNYFYSHETTEVRKVLKIDVSYVTVKSESKKAKKVTKAKKK